MAPVLTAVTNGLFDSRGNFLHTVPWRLARLYSAESLREGFRSDDVSPEFFRYGQLTDPSNQVDGLLYSLAKRTRAHVKQNINMATKVPNTV